ncbi:Uncharacterised protein [Staphylococcus intermedius NCTC 11048]|uniref:Uncharacterized protein n=1 Tax=Staphylococcus intermedius NCTC 11048 TaxID=1141106 RepID=A0A380G7T6_STAIN|nr:Uncharacterised protein [Staphylococcus intermedius NCTC 11048]
MDTGQWLGCGVILHAIPKYGIIFEAETHWVVTTYRKELGHS